MGCKSRPLVTADPCLLINRGSDIRFLVSGVSNMEDLESYKKLCRLHIECIRMLNGLEKTLERKNPERGHRWQLAEETAVYGVNDESFFQAGFTLTPETK
jgi:hypothetical protein